MIEPTHDAIKSALAALHDNQHGAAERLAVMVGRALRQRLTADVLDEARRALAGASLEPRGQHALDGLEAALSAEPAEPLRALEAIQSVDDQVSVLVATERDPAPLVEQARLLLALEAELVPGLEQAIALYAGSLGLDKADPAGPLWTVPSAASVEPSATPRLDAWLDAHSEGIVIPFRRPGASPVRYARAASEGAPVQAESVELMREGTRWSLCLESPVGTPELAFYAEPEDALAFQVTHGGDPLEVHDDGIGRRSVRLPDRPGDLQVTVGEQVLAIRYGDCD